MFKPVPPQLNIPLQEEQTLNFWNLHRIYAKCSQQRKDAPHFVFYERPPTANAVPTMQHAVGRVYQDLFLRYKTMRGYQVLRRGGWDTHGLPVEISVERKLGFTSKAQIEDYGIARFNELCRQSAFEYIKEWERFSNRLAYWVDAQNATVTHTNETIESVWWILKSAWDKGLLYQKYQVVSYCPRCGTTLSEHEVAKGQREIEDPSITVRLPLVDEPGTSLLVWTTTPWTLPANVAVAVHPDVDYVTVRRGMPGGGSERLILARERLEKVFGDQRVAIVDSFKGRKLKGKRYQPLFTFLHPDKPAYFVVMQESVNAKEGTGLVHTAPTFDAEGLQAVIDFDLPVLITVAEDGTFIPEIRPWSGQFVKDADPFIIEDLRVRGLLFDQGSYAHKVPFCCYCDTPLIDYARNAWFLRTSQFKDRLVELNRQINWVPPRFQEDRFGNWLENNGDWVLGRERFWGTPLPVWECRVCHRQMLIGSRAEISERAGRNLDNLDLHRPSVDELALVCPDCGPKNGATMLRVPEVLDAWFDSGSMPLAQWHYPFENQQVFRKQYPADFICEAFDQMRGWFYSLHAISALLHDAPAFKNVICLGSAVDANGHEMSKTHSNAIDPWQVFNTLGADALRWYLYGAAPPGQDLRLSLDLVGQVGREFSLTLWNVYSFFITSANLDGWTPGAALPQEENLLAAPGLDRWLRSELHTLVRDVSAALEAYDALAATRPIQAFVEDLSKWYLRCSRLRFRKNENEAEKRSAYETLYETLVITSKLLAPSMPFLAEALHHNLVRQVDPSAPESVHMCDWPEADLTAIDPQLKSDMRLIRRLASLGQAARTKAGIKVSQPLTEAAFALEKDEEIKVLGRHAGLLADALNVKRVRTLGSAGEAVTYRLRPLPRQLERKYKQAFPKISQAIQELDANQAARSLMAGESVWVNVEGEELEILPEEVEVITQAREGLLVAIDGATLAALRTKLTPELAQEGWAGEVVHQVQKLRKQAGMAIDDRIVLYVQATPGLMNAMRAFRKVIQAETHALELHEAEPPSEATITENRFDGQWIKTGIVRVEES